MDKIKEIVFSTAGTALIGVALLCFLRGSCGAIGWLIGSTAFACAGISLFKQAAFYEWLKTSCGNSLLFI